MNALLLVGAGLAVALFVFIDKHEVILDRFMPAEDPLEQFDPAEDSFDQLDVEDRPERPDTDDEPIEYDDI